MKLGEGSGTELHPRFRARNDLLVMVVMMMVMVVVMAVMTMVAVVTMVAVTLTCPFTALY